MEVLGAVASSIAVIQALAAGKHVVSLIREMPEIQKDFEYMMKELGLVRSMVQAVRSMSPTDFEQDLIDNACGNLEEVTKQLEALLRKCAFETDQGDKKVWKTKKRKWLLDRSDIQKLQQRMGQAKETLHFAVTSSQTSLNSQVHTEVRQMHTTLYMMNMQMCSTTEGLQAGHDRKTSLFETESGRLRAAVPFSQTVQTTSCQCRCHFSQSQYRNSGWMQSVLGSWLVRCDRIPKQECSDPTCLCIGLTSLKLEYQVPKWLILKTFRVFASYSSITGISCSLRPVRLLAASSQVWPNLKGSRQSVQKTVVKYGIYPHDAAPSGEGAMEYCINISSYSSIESLLDMWKNILAESGLPRYVIDAAFCITIISEKGNSERLQSERITYCNMSISTTVRRT
ncbi:hypothetical protein DER45DRAFT_372632 [Fusarium avenaceum]|nr:hypothetical protein DER45DRAFT_372632 [Fusarium avenaceum]